MESDTAMSDAPVDSSALDVVSATVVVLGCAVGMLVGFSASYFSTLSVFLKPVSAAFGWGRGEASAIASLAQLGLALGAPVTGRLIEHFGVRCVALTSTVLFGAGLFALSMSPGSIVMFGGLTLLLGFMAVGTTPAGYLSALPKYFDKRLGLAMGVAMIGLGCGNALMPLLVQRWIGEGGWQSAYRHVSLAVLVGGVATFLMLSGAGRATRPVTADRRAAREASTVHERAWPMIRTWRFCTLIVVFFVVSCAGLAAIVHIVPLLTDHGLAPAQASKIAALIGIGVMIGRAVTGLLIDNVHARYVAAIQFLVGGAGLALIAWSPGTQLPVVAAGAFAFAFVIGAEGDFMPFFIRRYFGTGHFSFLYGVLFFFFALGGVAGPIAFGWVFDRFHTYSMAYAGAGIACVMCAALVWALGEYTYPAD
ncbi:MFS transporter [Paraburkholderia sp. J63]|uniref:MFS transporter n=1 Tax=Paraburkholderia sp. J63 TaxID=2805434 RepID=UPI002ABD8661|nr:MFS transporter [Paraburkholderia sp. J63]